MTQPQDKADCRDDDDGDDDDYDDDDKQSQALMFLLVSVYCDTAPRQGRLPG